MTLLERIRALRGLTSCEMLSVDINVKDTARYREDARAVLCSCRWNRIEFRWAAHDLICLGALWVGSKGP